jgi:preprotein translocase subunit SecF
MNTLKGYRLYVQLSASQTRRRLRGHGFGVRKVQSAGRAEAVIIHTATGQHRRELEALFQDVMKPTGDDNNVSHRSAVDSSSAEPLN